MSFDLGKVAQNSQGKYWPPWSEAHKRFRSLANVCNCIGYTFDLGRGDTEGAAVFPGGADEVAENWVRL
jgi:hypothetical protein